jgi:hypothetical protein
MDIRCPPHVLQIFSQYFTRSATFDKGFSTTVFKFSLPVLCGYVFHPDRDG